MLHLTCVPSGWALPPNKLSNFSDKTKLLWLIKVYYHKTAVVYVLERKVLPFFLTAQKSPSVGFLLANNVQQVANRSDRMNFWSSVRTHLDGCLNSTKKWSFWYAVLKNLYENKSYTMNENKRIYDEKCLATLWIWKLEVSTMSESRNINEMRRAKNE